MSFKLPKELEPLGFKQITDINRLEVGDLLVIPSAKDAPKLRVSINTLRKWGLNVTSSDSIRRYSCDRYSAARSVFGKMGSWHGADERDDKSHVLLVESASHDKNSAYGKHREISLTFENANSIKDSRVTVEAPVFPLTSIRTIPCKPLYPKKTNRTCLGSPSYPHTFGCTTDLKACELLLRTIGNDALPTIANVGNLKTAGYCELPFFMTVASCIFGAPQFSGILSKKQLDPLNGLFVNYYYSRRSHPPDVDTASSLFMTAPGAKSDIKLSEYRADSSYFPGDFEGASDASLHMPSVFVSNIVKRGALMYRAPGVQKMMSTIMAQEVARNMDDRFATMIEKVQNLVDGLKKELPVIKRIEEKYRKAVETLNIDDSIVKSVSKIF